MEIKRTRVELLSALRDARRPFVIVPTMGALHEGHMSLVRRAKDFGGTLIVSLFVNPLQFAPGEDYEDYPRTFEEDLKKLEGLSGLLFAPPLEEMYQGEQEVRIALPPLARELCGASRPHYFEGVAVVVAKLLNLVRPDAAVFGKKDYQQGILVRMMVDQLDYPVRIELCETVREGNGLAMSSRNAYLSKPELDKASALHRTLKTVANALAAGQREPRIGNLLSDQRDELVRMGFVPDYLEVRSACRLEPPAYKSGERLVVLGAATLGKCRLIDNCEATRP